MKSHYTLVAKMLRHLDKIGHFSFTRLDDFHHMVSLLKPT